MVGPTIHAEGRAVDATTSGRMPCVDHLRALSGADGEEVISTSTYTRLQKVHNLTVAGQRLSRGLSHGGYCFLAAAPSNWRAAFRCRVLLKVWLRPRLVERAGSKFAIVYFSGAGCPL